MFKKMSVPLPNNITLLSDKDLQDLINNHKRELSQYVKQYQTDNIDTIVRQTEIQKKQLLSLRDKYSELERCKINLNKDIDSIRLLYEQYSTKWQRLDTLFKQEYSEDAFKNQLKRDVKDIDHQSEYSKDSILSMTDLNQLDDLLEQYKDKRKQYHYSKEQLTTWQQQGTLKN